jgi:hypothetical protein
MLPDSRRLNLAASQVQVNVGHTCLLDLSKRGSDMLIIPKAPTKSKVRGPGGQPSPK